MSRLQAIPLRKSAIRPFAMTTAIRPAGLLLFLRHLGHAPGLFDP
jgi:hypothetical protein